MSSFNQNPPSFNLLAEPLIRARLATGEIAALSLPAIYAALMRDDRPPTIPTSIGPFGLASIAAFASASA